MNFLYELFGTIGLVLLLVAFILNAQKHTKRRTLFYNGANFVGSLILCMYAYINGSFIFIVLELIWALIAVYFFFSILHERHLAPRKKKKKN